MPDIFWPVSFYKVVKIGAGRGVKKNKKVGSKKRRQHGAL